MERKVWLRAFKRTLYASLYVLLIGGPGVGKTDALRNVISMWEELPTIHVAPTSVSRASLADELLRAARQVFRPMEKDPQKKFNSLQAAITEFGTFLTAYDGEFISTLNDLYDCIRYKESKRHMKEPLVIDHPQFNFIAGTTPSWLGNSLPAYAWSEGFSSRMLMVFSAERLKIHDPWADDDIDSELRDRLVSDLKQIHELYGAFQIEEDFMVLYKNWYHTDCAPVPEHPKLEHYLPRRHVHFLKICMIMSLARSNELVLRIDDFVQAQDLLLEAERYMPDVFKSMRLSSDVNVYDEVYNYVYVTFLKENKPIAEHRIIHFISERAPNQAVTNVLKVMVDSGMLKIGSITGPGGRPMYVPTPKDELGR